MSHNGSPTGTTGSIATAPEIDVFRWTFDPTAPESVSIAVVDALAAATGGSVTEVGPLSRVVNSDALDDLFCQPSDRTGEPTASVTFVIEGVRVTVRERGVIEIRPLGED